MYARPLSFPVPTPERKGGREGGREGGAVLLCCLCFTFLLQESRYLLLQCANPVICICVCGLLQSEWATLPLNCCHPLIILYVNMVYNRLSECDTVPLKCCRPLIISYVTMVYHCLMLSYLTRHTVIYHSICIRSIPWHPMSG